MLLTPENAIIVGALCVFALVYAWFVLIAPESDEKAGDIEC